MSLGKVRYESKYLAVRHFYAEKHWSIEWMCRQLEISRAAYYHCKTPLEIRQEALASDMPTGCPVPENKRINKYKENWCA